MSDINEERTQKDQIILNKSVIEQHLKTQFTETQTPKLKLQTILKSKESAIAQKFIFDEEMSPEIKKNKNQNYLKTNTLETASS